jgi:hypothetical protein
MKRHRFDALSFSFGAAFAALSIVLSVQPLEFGAPSLRWVAAGFLLLLGALLILTSRTRSRDRS